VKVPIPLGVHVREIVKAIYCGTTCAQGFDFCKLKTSVQAQQRAVSVQANLLHTRIRTTGNFNFIGGGHGIKLAALIHDKQ
jgi:hypothetical protein